MFNRRADAIIPLDKTRMSSVLNFFYIPLAFDRFLKIPILGYLLIVLCLQVVIVWNCHVDECCLFGNFVNEDQIWSIVSHAMVCSIPVKLKFLVLQY